MCIYVTGAFAYLRQNCICVVSLHLGFCALVTMDDYIESLKQRSRQLEMESQYLRDMVSQLTTNEAVAVSEEAPSQVFVPSFQQQEQPVNYMASPIVRVKLLKTHSQNEFNPFVNRISVLNKVHKVEVVQSKLLKTNQTNPINEPIPENTAEVCVPENYEENPSEVHAPENSVNEEEILVSDNVQTSDKVVLPVVAPKPKTSLLLSKQVAQPKGVPKQKQAMYIHKSTEFHKPTEIHKRDKILFTKEPTNSMPFIKANTQENKMQKSGSNSIKSRLPKMSTLDSLDIEESLPERISGAFIRPIVHRPRNFIYPSPIHSIGEIPYLSSKFPKILPQYLPKNAVIDHTWVSMDQGPLAASSVAVFAMYHEYLFKAQPSVLQLYYMARSKTDKALDVGTNFIDIFWTYSNHGWCHESNWEWNHEMFHMEPVIPKVMEPYNLNPHIVESHHEVQKCIKDMRPVMVSILVFRDLLEVPMGMTIKTPPPDETPLGNQCFLIVGYTDKVYSCVTSLSKTPKMFNLEINYLHSYATELFVVY